MQDSDISVAVAVLMIPSKSVTLKVVEDSLRYGLWLPSL
jgi:hypothetical protein